MQGSKDFSDGPSPLLFDGSNAAAVAHSARPLDVMIIANRLDAGALTCSLLLLPLCPASPHNVVPKFSLQKSVRRVVAGVKGGVSCWLVDNSHWIVGVH